MGWGLSSSQGLPEGQAGRGQRGLSAFCLPGEGGLQSLLGSMSHSQLMQLIGPAGLGGLGNARPWPPPAGQANGWPSLCLPGVPVLPFRSSLALSGV